MSAIDNGASSMLASDADAPVIAKPTKSINIEATLASATVLSLRSPALPRSGGEDETVGRSRASATMPRPGTFSTLAVSNRT
jgi:hypothetical protein